MKWVGLKKAGAVSREARLGWIEIEHKEVPLMRQCELASVPRATNSGLPGFADERLIFRQDDMAICIKVDCRQTRFFTERHLLIVTEIGLPPATVLVAKNIAATASRWPFVPPAVRPQEVVRSREHEGVTTSDEFAAA